VKKTPEQVIEWFNQLKSERSTWETHWQECSEYIIPRKDQITKMSTPGEKRGLELLDNTAMMSNELLAGALHGLLTNPNADWFEFTTGDEQLDERDDVRFWLQRQARKAHNVLNNSNFNTEVHEMYLDICGFGTASFLSEEDEDSIVRFSSKPVQEVFIDENNKGQIDELCRSFKWTAKQIVQEFGMGVLKKSRKVEESFKKGKGEKFEILHAIYPVLGEKKQRFPYASQYVLVCEKVFLEDGKGFREFPYAVPRWTKTSDEKYGRGPGMNALPEAKMLNAMMDTTIRGAQKVVDPPLMLPDDGFIWPILTKPGGLNFYRAGSTDRIEPFANEARIDFGIELISMKQKSIREAFYVDQLKLQQEGPQMTATEVIQRNEDAMKLLGPMLGRLQSEFLRPVIDRVFAIMLRKGMIDPAPAVLRGRVIDVKYSSLIARAQRSNEGSNIIRTIQTAEPFINADPSVLDNINGDIALRKIARIYGFPQEILRTEKQVLDIRKARAEAQEEALRQQQAAAETEQATKVVSAQAQAQRVG